MTRIEFRGIHDIIVNIKDSIETISIRDNRGSDVDLVFTEGDADFLRTVLNEREYGAKDCPKVLQKATTIKPKKTVRVLCFDICKHYNNGNCKYSVGHSDDGKYMFGDATGSGECRRYEVLEDDEID